MPGVAADVLFDGLPAQNRSVEGDVVAFRLLPESEWAPLDGDAAAAQDDEAAAEDEELLQGGDSPGGGGASAPATPSIDAGGEISMVDFLAACKA